MAYDASTDYRAIQNALKKQMEETTAEKYRWTEQTNRKLVNL